jgi:hypothetical protein
MSALAPMIVDKIKPLIRLLSSDRDGEIVAAARALMRLLKASGADIHTLADSIGQVDVRVGAYNNIDAKSWHQIATFCQQHHDRLRSNEREFIANIAASTVWGEPTPKQQKWLRSIFLRLGGKP